MPVDKTFREIGEMIGMTPEGVRIVEKRAINKLFMTYVKKYNCSYTHAFENMSKLLKCEYADFYELLDEEIKLKLKEENT
jgi:hypothetical protein